jgi:hypothetical protein
MKEKNFQIVFMLLDSSEEEINEDEYDPSPMCNCGECTPGNYTCVRRD